MYLPKHNIADADTLQRLLADVRAADLVSATAQGLYVTFLPLIFEASAGEHGALLGHVARKNDHWRLETIGESMVIVHGPDGYISPSWYAAKREHGKVVPTWNYTTAHVYGELRIHDDVEWLEAFVRRLTDRYESERDHPWAVDDAPRPYLDGQLKAIVGVELVINRIEAKAKLGQQRSAADIEGTINGLRADGEEALAMATEAVATQQGAAAPGDPTDVADSAAPGEPADEVGAAATAGNPADVTGASARARGAGAGEPSSRG